MPRPRSKRAVAQRFCPGCRQDRYNHKGMCERPGLDAPVTSEFCWNNDPAKAVYCRAEKKWAMPCHSSHWQQWIAEYAKTGRRPQWNPYT